MFKRLALHIEEINATPVIDTTDATRQELRLYCNLLNTADEIKETRIHINK